MLCTYCKSAHIENEAPCPNCGAPSPYLQVSQHGGWGTEGMQGYNGSNSGGQWGQQNVPQYSFEQSIPQQHFPSGQLNWQQGQDYQNPLPPWQQGQENQHPLPAWQQGQEQQAGMQQQDHMANQALLPVPYQETGLQSRQNTITLQLVPDQALHNLLPAEPLPQPDTVYVPPMYTKPRPLIPKYRVISGFLSVLIVALLACTGTGYYVKASGYWDKAVAMYTGAPQPNLTQGTSKPIGDPPKEDVKKDRGPAYKFISVATTASRIDNNQSPAYPDRIFRTSQDIFLTFTVQKPDKDGYVTTKWYINSKFYLEYPSKEASEKDKNNTFVKKGEAKNGSINMKYSTPCQGMVEIYWNGQFAQRLFFAVK